MADPSRRAILIASGAALSALAGGCSPSDERPSGASSNVSADGAAGSDDLQAVMTALHVHASFSEGTASMVAQLDQAQELGVRALWWTEHDWRMAASGYLDRVPFVDSPDGSVRWSLDRDRAAGAHAIRPVRSNGTEGDESQALWLSVKGTAGQRQQHRLRAEIADDLIRTSLHGQTWHVTVFIEEREGRAHLALEVVTSRRPAAGDLDAGTYRLSYHLGSGDPRPPHATGRTVAIGVEVPSGQWTTVTLHPAIDLSNAWIGVDGRDASCVHLEVAALAQDGGAVTGLFHELTIERDEIAGDLPMQTQRAIIDVSAPAFPDMDQFQGVELSAGVPHVCWYGSSPGIPESASSKPLSLVPQIVSSGGVACYAHPFGVSASTPVESAQSGLVAQVADSLLDSRAFGCNALEVGYRQRGGATLTSHESLWDACSRRGILLTGVGVNDNHSGTGWVESPNNFVSWLWARGSGEDELVSALRSGYVFFGDPVRFTGQLDIMPAVGGHLGSVVPRVADEIEVDLLARGLPGASSLELLLLRMDPAARPENPDDAVVLQVAARDMDPGVTRTTVSTTSDCMVRTRVRASSGELIALSNPVWFLEDPSSADASKDRLINT